MWFEECWDERPFRLRLSFPPFLCVILFQHCHYLWTVALHFSNFLHGSIRKWCIGRIGYQLPCLLLICPTIIPIWSDFSLKFSLPSILKIPFSSLGTNFLSISPRHALPSQIWILWCLMIALQYLLYRQPLAATDVRSLCCSCSSDSSRSRFTDKSSNLNPPIHLFMCF
jgi:hypothetical protein